MVHLNYQIFSPGQRGAYRLLPEFQGAATRRSFFSVSLRLGHGSAKHSYKKGG